MQMTTVGDSESSLSTFSSNFIILLTTLLVTIVTWYLPTTPLRWTVLVGQLGRTSIRH